MSRMRRLASEWNYVFLDIALRQRGRDPFAMAIAIDTLAYGRRLREAGFSEQQAEGQAEALAAVMTDSLAMKQDLRDLEVRIDSRFAQVDARFAQVDARFEHLEKHLDTRLAELTARVGGQLADLERRMTVRLLAGIVAVSALVKLL